MKSPLFSNSYAQISAVSRGSINRHSCLPATQEGKRCQSRALYARTALLELGMGYDFGKAFKSISWANEWESLMTTVEKSVCVKYSAQN